MLDPITYDGWFEVAEYKSDLGTIRKARGEYMTVVSDGWTTVYLRQVGNPEDAFDFYIQDDPVGQDAGSWGRTWRSVAWDDAAQQWVGDVTHEGRDCDGRVESYRPFTVQRVMTPRGTTVAGMLWDWSPADTRDHAAEAAGY
ncbi:MAG: hypothetical protein ACO29V_04565 [Limnohabitans sp.]